MASLTGLNIVDGKVSQSIFFLFISESCHPHNLAAMSLQVVNSLDSMEIRGGRSFGEF